MFKSFVFLLCRVSFKQSDEFCFNIGHQSTWGPAFGVHFQKIMGLGLPFKA